jgi:phage terminase large subunit
MNYLQVLAYQSKLEKARRIVEQRTDDAESLAVAADFRGQNAAFVEYTGHESILSGPFETGKTFAGLMRFHRRIVATPNAHCLMLRKTYADLHSSAIVTYETKVLAEIPRLSGTPIKKYGGNRPANYEYPNGQRIVVAGLDRPGKALSAEYDYIYVNQAEDLTLPEWEILTGRVTGRAGNTDKPEIFGDVNPEHELHWILHRPEIKLFHSRHEDNPTLFNDDGILTDQGERTMRILDALTGVRYKRGRLGLWVSAEGQIYEEYDPAIHVVDELPATIKRRFRSIDFGYVNPFVCQWWAEDADGRLYLYRELYMSGRLVEDHAAQIKQLTGDEFISFTVADHDAEDRATLLRYGIPTTPAVKEVTPGIGSVQARLRLQSDGKPRLFFVRNALIETDAQMRDLHRPTSTVQELPSYVWEPRRDGRPAKEQPVKVDDHGMDTMRYLVHYIDGRHQQKLGSNIGKYA